MVTIKDIALRLGVSISTVSKVLNGASDVGADVRRAVLDTAVEMGYVTKKMKKEQFKKLCIFIENMEYADSEDFGHDIVLGFKQAAFRDNWEVQIQPITPLFQTREKYDTYMLQNGFSGGFLVGFALHDDWMSQLAATSVPTALFDNYVARNPQVGYVGADSFEGIDAAVEHLVGLGHKNIAFLNGSLYSMISDQRQQAFLDSMKSHGLTPRKDLMAYGYFVADSAHYHVSSFLSAGATAILCGNDLIASGVIEECRLRGYRIPRDISVVGFDDLPLSLRLSPPLTTIRQDRRELGRCGYHTLSSLIHGIPISKTLLRAQLVVRQSTGPVGGA